MARRKTARRKTDNLRFAIYARCSTDDQAHRDFSTIDAQIEYDTQYILEQGGELIGIYRDEGRSGTSLERPDWKRLLADAQAAKFDAVVVTYMSRLGRGDMYTVAAYLLKQERVEVHTVKERFTDDMSGYVNKQMTQFVDGMYVQQVRQWTNAKMEAMVKLGYACGGTIPFGLLRIPVENPATMSRNDSEPPKRYILHPDEAPLVARAFEIFASSSSMVQTQNYLNSVTTRRWSFANVTYLLRNEAYRGVLVFGPWRNDNSHEPIVSEELWQRVRQADTARIRTPKHNPIDTFPYYLRGLVHCPHCGCRMTPAAHPGRNSVVCYYECIQSFKGKSQGCPVRRVNARTLHHAILDEIAAIAAHPEQLTDLLTDVASALPDAHILETDLNGMLKRLQQVEKEIGNVTSAIAASGMTLRPLVMKLEQLETERLQVEQQRRELQDQVDITRFEMPDVNDVADAWSRIAELWEAATDEERETIMQGFVSKVVMTDKEEGTCEISLFPQVPASWLELTSKLGAPFYFYPI